MLFPPASADRSLYLNADLFTRLLDSSGLLIDACLSTFRDIAADAHADLLAMEGVSPLRDLHSGPVSLPLITKGQTAPVYLLQVPANATKKLPQLSVIALEELGSRQIDAECTVGLCDACDALVGERRGPDQQGLRPPRHLFWLLHRHSTCSPVQHCTRSVEKKPDRLGQQRSGKDGKCQRIHVCASSP